MYKLEGTIKVINDTVQVSEKFAKREFVVEVTSGMYPQDIILQAAQDKCSMLDAYAEGEAVEVSFNLRGREWTSPQGEVKYFNTLDAWRIEKSSGMNSAPSQAESQTSQASTAEIINEEEDDLPF